MHELINVAVLHSSSSVIFIQVCVCVIIVLHVVSEPGYCFLLRHLTMETSKSKESSFGLSYPMLTKTNYTTWALKMKVFMQAHGVWEAIEPKDTKAVIDDKIDKRALAVIYQGIPEDLLLALAEKKTSKEAWTAVKTMCLGADKVKKARALTLKGEFEALSMKETEQLDEFYMKLNGLVTNIRALGEKMEEAYVVKKLLRSVPLKISPNCICY